MYDVKYQNTGVYEYAQLQANYDKTYIITGIPNAHRYAKVKDFDTNLYHNNKLAYESKEKIKRFVEHFEKFVYKGVGLYIYSPSSGAGKTLLASILANALIRQYNETPRFIKAATFFEESKRALSQVNKDNPVAQDKLKMLTSAKVLIIDDLGAERHSDYTNTVLYELISKRTDLRKVTIITSRKKADELKYDASTISQINASTRLVELPNENVGVKVANANNKELDALLEV